MIRTAEEILNDALQLSEEDRERVADSLLRSVHAHSDESVEQAWIAEARRRCAEIDEGTVEMAPWDDVMKDLRKMIAQKPFGA